MIKSKKDINDISICFTIREHGWIYLTIEISSIIIELHLSALIDPIPDIFEWLIKLNNNENIGKLIIDEEGNFKILIFEKKYTLNKEIYVFKIVSDRSLFIEYEIIKETHKDKIIEAFVQAFEEIKNTSKVVQWAGYDLKKYITEMIKQINQSL